MALLRKQRSSAFKSSRTTNIRYSKQPSLPPGSITEFVWKDYSSAIFRKIQEFGDVSYEEYMVSICRHETLMELALRGGCGRPFYLSHDERFVIKTLRKSEAKVLIEMLPSYYAHLQMHGKSLLTKYYGLHAARPGTGGQKVYFVVMENLLNTQLHIHRRYDLKGSSQGRSPSKGGAQARYTLKDLDFDFCFYLEPPIRNQLLEQIKLDCNFLEEQGIMDYSLLLGVHIQALQLVSTEEKVFQEPLVMEPIKEHTLEDTTQTQQDLERDPNNESHHRRDPTLSDFFPPGYSSRPDSRFGAKLPARAVQIRQSERESSVSSHKTRIRDGSNVYLYLGIIDFLQSYNVIKRIEHAYKSLQYDGRAIPSVNPKLYAARFQDYLCRVFLAEEFCPQSPELFLSNTPLS